jgi:hypothetical protein
MALDRMNRMDRNQAIDIPSRFLFIPFILSSLLSIPPVA